jgi:hypothetical protein
MQKTRKLSKTRSLKAEELFKKIQVRRLLRKIPKSMTIRRG